MTRKDYILIAEAMLASKPFEYQSDAIKYQWAIGVQQLADRLANDNSRFDRERFLKACGVQPS